MRIRRGAAVLLVLVASLAGCSGSSATEEPAAAFTAHFTDPIYEDVSNDLTPFGSDEGADILADWKQRRDELGPTSTVADVLGEDPFAYQSKDDIYSLMEVQAAGFTLLRLTGQIDPEGKKATLDAIDSLIADWQGNTPELLRQRDDLRSWTG